MFHDRGFHVSASSGQSKACQPNDTDTLAENCDDLSGSEIMGEIASLYSRKLSRSRSRPSETLRGQ